jgi:RNA polymerase sigma factor (sigma-70 family)
MSFNYFSYNPSQSENPADQLVNDQILWQSIRKGNQLAFSSLYKKYVNALYNYGMHIQADHDEVVDTIQELFVNIWSRRESMAEVSKVKYYIFKSFKNLYVNRLQQVRKLKGGLNDPLLSASVEDSFEEELILSQTKQQQSKKLNAAVEQLTKRQKEAVLLKYYNELTFTQVATVMGISVEAVQNLLSKAIQLLKARM